MTNDNLPPDDIKKQLSTIGKNYPISEVMGDFDPSNCYDGWTEELRYFFYRYDEHLAQQACEKLNEHQWNKIWEAETAKSVSTSSHRVRVLTTCTISAI